MFVKGKSGNPSGRKKNTPESATLLRAMIVPHAPQLLQTVINSALSGDMVAANMLLQRVLPVLKPQTEPQSFAINMQGTASEQCQSILEAIAAGSIDPDTGSGLIRAISDTVKVYDSTILLERLDALEKGADQ